MIEQPTPEKQPPQLPKLPTSAIETDRGLEAKNQRWFEYPVKAQPHHTDYAGIVWHGTYLTWMEEARVEYLRSIGIEFSDLVAMGCDLPVVELSLRYHLPIRLGVSAIVKVRLVEGSGVRINWEYEIQSYDRQKNISDGNSRAGRSRSRKRQDYASACCSGSRCFSQAHYSLIKVTAMLPPKQISTSVPGVRSRLAYSPW